MIEAVEGGFGAFGEHGVDIVAHQRAASEMECERKLALAAQLDLQGGDVEGVGDFPLHLVVIDYGVVAGHDFGDRVGEVGWHRRCR